jgi:LmbE family N-acetylglucosaminyl deacetylase
MSDGPAAALKLDAGTIAALAGEFQRAYVWRKVVERPAATRALLVAAHADDVEIGCAGSLLQMIDAGVAAQQVVLTDGRLAALEPSERDAMARTRHDEAKSVAAHLMLPPPEWFGVPEGELAQPQRERELVERLAGVVAAFRPDALFVPWYFDQHPDHRYANHLLARALTASRLELAKTTVYAYEAWSLVPPAIVVDVSRVYAEKKRLISLYRSQLAQKPYLTLVEQLSEPRARLAGPRATAAEFFLPMAGDVYVKRAAALDLASPASLATNVFMEPLG